MNIPKPAFLTLQLILLLGLLKSGGEYSAHAGEPPVAPVLRIETGMHTASIARIATDAQDRFLVTASTDKTARVWDLKSGALLRTIRPPLGEGHEGKLSAVVLSPDGGTVACAGWTADKNNNIYLFERASGRMLRRIRGLPDVIQHLALSPDGRVLAATLGSGGLRVFRTTDGRLLNVDREYRDNSYGAAFDAGGRLVTSCDDGYLRLYDRNFKCLFKKKLRGGNRPFAVSFSPGGAQIAVGFQDSTNLEVVSGRDLSFLFAPNTKSVDNGNLGCVAFSSDGRFLYAGGEWGLKDGTSPIRRWANGGRGAFRTLPGANNTIFDLKPLRGGGVAFGAGDPAWGVLVASGGRALWTPPAIANFHSKENFLLSPDGARVAFVYEQGDKSPAHFALTQRTLTTPATREVEARSSPSSVPSLVPSSRDDLKAPVTTASGLKLTDWENNFSPKFNGKPLVLELHEFSRSLAIAPDSSGFLLGTEWYLRFYDRSGKERWKASVPGAAWSVNIAGNDKVGIAAFSDGTIRWYRLTDGRELLAFFPHADKERWVIWTPSGYYDCSAGGEDLIGWHMNRGKDKAADFFLASRFRERFYRPDVIQKVLASLDEAKALKLANTERDVELKRLNLEAPLPEAKIAEALPPVVRIITPNDESAFFKPEITVRYAVRTPSGDAVTEVRALVDGRPATVARDLNIVAKENETTREMVVPLPARDCEVAIIAVNKNAASEPGVVRLSWRGKVAHRANAEQKYSVWEYSAHDYFGASVVRTSAPSEDSSNSNKGIGVTKGPVASGPRRYGNLFILAVGVNDYNDKSGLRDLSWAAPDGHDFVQAMSAQKGVLYDEIEARLLTDKNEEKPTRANILEALEWIKNTPTSDDMAMLFFSEHGASDPNNKYYFLPSEYETDKMRSTGLRHTEITETVRYCKARVLLFLDTCRSGNVLSNRAVGMALTRATNELSSAETGAVVFTASQGDEDAVENPQWQNGAFTEALVRGLQGEGQSANRKGEVSFKLLDIFVHDLVYDELTAQRQGPLMATSGLIKPFIIAMKAKP